MLGKELQKMKYPVITPEERRQRLEPPRKKIHAVIDSDTYNEVDDQFAISYAMHFTGKNTDGSHLRRTFFIRFLCTLNAD